MYSFGSLSPCDKEKLKNTIRQIQFALRFKKKVRGEYKASVASNSENSDESATEDSENEEFHPDVFLGGSCNPTTWRHDIAIPLLKKDNVTFFNPQVGEWSEDLVERESRAKETCEILLFVIDNKTRSLVSMNEAAEYICRGKRVMLVLQGIMEGTLIGGVPLCKAECDILNDSRRHLVELAERNNIECFTDVGSAVKSIIDSVKRARSRKSRRLSSKRLKARGSSPQKENIKSPTFHSDVCLCHPKDEESTNIVYNQRLCTCATPSSSLVFLGGAVRNTSWRKDEAIPFLEKAQAKYFSALDDDTPEVFELGKDQSDVMLIVIGKNTRSLSDMTEAIELMCKGRRMVLVIEEVQEGAVIDGEVIYGRELLDLNRARCYLRESAARHKIRCFSTVVEALESIVASEGNPQM